MPSIPPILRLPVPMRPRIQALTAQAHNAWASQYPSIGSVDQLNDKIAEYWLGKRDLFISSAKKHGFTFETRLNPPAIAPAIAFTTYGSHISILPADSFIVSGIVYAGIRWRQDGTFRAVDLSGRILTKIAAALPDETYDSDQLIKMRIRDLLNHAGVQDVRAPDHHLDQVIAMGSLLVSLESGKGLWASSAPELLAFAPNDASFQQVRGALNAYDKDFSNRLLGFNFLIQ